MSKSNSKPKVHTNKRPNVQTSKCPNGKTEVTHVPVALAIAQAAWKVAAVPEVDLASAVVPRHSLDYVEQLWNEVQHEFPGVDLDYVPDQRWEAQTVLLFRKVGG